MSSGELHSHVSFNGFMVTLDNPHRDREVFKLFRVSRTLLFESYFIFEEQTITFTSTVFGLQPKFRRRVVKPLQIM